MLWWEGVLDVHTSTFTENEANIVGVAPSLQKEEWWSAGLGGAIFAGGSETTVNDSTFTTNTAIFVGGKRGVF